MAFCTHSSSCPLFGLFTVDTTLSPWRRSYCEADYARCARLRRALCGADVPRTLLPNGKLLRPTLPPSR